MSRHKTSRISAPTPKYSSKNKILDGNKITSDYEDVVKKPTLKFSFKFLDFNDPLFQIDHCKSKWFKQLFERKKNYCSMDPATIKNGGDATRCHPIKWEETNRPMGFSIGTKLSRDIDAHQLTISQNNGRIHGFFTEDIFNLVWFDPDHLLYKNHR
jgi:hypothetical protein